MITMSPGLSVPTNSCSMYCEFLSVDRSIEDARRCQAVGARAARKVVVFQ